MTTFGRAIVLGMSVLTVGLSVQACTLGSPTYVTAKQVPEENEDADGGAASSASATAGSVASCGTDDWDTTPAASLTACGNGKGHCVDKTKIPMADQLTACPDATKVCVGDEFINAGGKKLATCQSIVGTGGGCVNMDLIPQMKARGGSSLKQDACPAGLTCAPCIDPTNGNAPTGMCEPVGVHKNACTAGTGAAAAPAAPSQTCCMNKASGKPAGVCLSQDAVPAANRDSVNQDTCSSTDKCVPAAMVNGTAVKCVAGAILGAGVCMDGCFNDTLNIVGEIGFLDQATCGAGEFCIPCSFAPAGTPGCS